MSNKIDRTLLALMAVALAALPFVASGYVIYVVNLLMVFVVLALGLHLVIGDNGVGINAVESPGGKSIGVGVMGMRERVHELGGRISIRKVLQGTVLTVSLPRQKRTVLAPLVGAQ